MNQSEAKKYLASLGYEDLSQVPTGRGNDDLTAAVYLAKGVLDETPFEEAVALARALNSAKAYERTVRTALLNSVGDESA